MTDRCCAACGDRISAKSMSGLCHPCAMRDKGVGAYAEARIEREAQRQAVIAQRKAARERPVKVCEVEGCNTVIGTKRHEARVCYEHRAERSSREQRIAASGWPRGRSKACPLDLRQPHIAAAVNAVPLGAGVEQAMLAAMVAAGVAL